eukprot:4240819-Amphidinium_carterae.1
MPLLVYRGDVQALPLCIVADCFAQGCLRPPVFSLDLSLLITDCSAKKKTKKKVARTLARTAHELQQHSPGLWQPLLLPVAGGMVASGSPNLPTALSHEAGARAEKGRS